MKQRIAWLVPAPLKGSGGHRTIYQHVNALADAGYDCHVFAEVAPSGHDPQYSTATSVKRIVEDFFGPIAATFHIGYELDSDFDLAFATAWFTAEPLRDETRAARKAYFVQDYEAFFHPMSDGFVLAQNTFRMGFRGISIGAWLPHRLDEEFQMPCAKFDFCADLSVYRARPDVPRERAICFVYQPEKPRRCSAVGGEALAIVKNRLPDVGIYFYGNDSRPTVPYEVNHLGLISIDACASLYAKCMVGLCISTTNPSRVPFEMMAAGLAVVDVHGDNNLFDMPEEAVLLAEPTPESIAHAIIQLFENEEDRQRRASAGVEFMSHRDLPVAFQQFVHVVQGMLSDRPSTEPVPRKIYTRPPVKAPDDIARAYRSARIESRRHYEAIRSGNAFPMRSGPDDRAITDTLSWTAMTRKRFKRAYKAFVKS